MHFLPAATAFVLSLAVLLGGATRQGYLGDVAVQVAACGLFGMALWSFCEPGRGRLPDALGKALLALAALLCVVQILPFFPGLGLGSLSIPDAAGGSLDLARSWWSPVSLTPAATWAGLTSALVPVAVFAAVTQCDAAGRLLLWRVVLGLGGLALILGVLQMLQGPGSALRFFAVTNPEEAVGFFANRNHFAAQLYVTLAFAGVWIATSGRQLIRRRGIDSLAAVSVGGAIAFLLLLTAGLAMARSRAGVLIAMGVVVGVAAMVLLAPKGAESAKIRGVGTRAILLAIAFAVLLATQLGLHQIIGRFEAEAADDLRWPLSWATFGAALSAVPMGTGIGSFVRVYGAIEEPANLLAAYVNRAHNDLAEFLLETGVLGGLLVLLFLVWFGRHALAVWRPRKGPESDMELALQRAATLVVAGLLVHALVDYGLRTTALSALFAFACGLLTRPAPGVPERRKSAAGSTRSKAPAVMSRRPAAAAATAPVANTVPRPDWRAEIEWPEQWRSVRDVRPGAADQPAREPEGR